MTSERVRRLTVLLLALALTAGLVSHGVRAADMGLNMMTVAAASDMPVSGKCDGCNGGDDGMPVGTCSAYCGTVSALPSIPSASDILPLDMRQHPAVPMGTGWGVPPDPYPPRPAVLS